MSINVIKGEYPESEYLFCDLCRGGDCSYKFSKFKQYNGWYCRNCFELKNEDDDEYDDNNFKIVLRVLKISIEVSTPLFNKIYYNMKQICKEIRDEEENM
jgi:hypothetical protein